MDSTLTEDRYEFEVALKVKRDEVAACELVGCDNRR
jgi:hypothetical protein